MLKLSHQSLNLFQFTLPRGERPSTPSALYSVSGFNSRSREGSDGDLHGLDARPSGFNSRSREGSDL